MPYECGDPERGIKTAEIEELKNRKTQDQDRRGQGGFMPMVDQSQDRRRRIIPFLYKAFCIGEQALLYFSALVLVAILAITDINVIGRYLNMPLQSSFEAVTLLFVVLSMAPLAYVQRERGHIGVEFIKERVSPLKVAIMDLILGILLCLFLAVFTWQSIRYASNNWYDYSVAIIKWPYWPVLIFLPLSFGFTCIRVFHQIFESMQTLKELKIKEEGKERE